jgi:hypothetical protein
MPSISLSRFPSSTPSWRPSDLPSTNMPEQEVIPTVIPSTHPTRTIPPAILNPTPRSSSALCPELTTRNPALPLLGQCQGDCDTDFDCELGLFCYQRDENGPVPGCPLAEFDTSRTDYCTFIPPAAAPVVAPVQPPTADSFRLKLHWEEGYMWQAENFERKWCMRCIQECQKGDKLFLHECAGDSVYFDFLENGDHETQMIQVGGTSLCLERFQSAIALETCNSTDGFQQWTSTYGNNSSSTSERFDISQTYHGEDYCMTTHHHPKCGEEVELHKCSVARRDTTSFWNKF